MAQIYATELTTIFATIPRFLTKTAMALGPTRRPMMGYAEYKVHCNYPTNYYYYYYYYDCSIEGTNMTTSDSAVSIFHLFLHQS